MKTFIFVAALIAANLTLTGCGGDSHHDRIAITEYSGSDTNTSPKAPTVPGLPDATEIDETELNCEAGVDGPGIIGGTKLNNNGRLGRGVVYIFNFDSSNNGGACTGSLIGSNMVLTAAHCIPYLKGTTIVAFSTYPECVVDRYQADKMKNPKLQIRMVEAVAIHPLYEGNNERHNPSYDIAILRFEKIAPASYIPLGLPYEFQGLQPKSVVIAAGYGKTEDYNVSAPKDGRLQFVNLTPVEPFIDGPFEMNIPEGMFLGFDQQNHKGVCAGDSGGPALQMTSKGLVVIGIASGVGSATGDGPVTCHGVSIHNNVFYYRHWIKSTYEALKTDKSSENPYKDLPDPAPAQEAPADKPAPVQEEAPQEPTTPEDPSDLNDPNNLAV